MKESNMMDRSLTNSMYSNFKSERLHMIFQISFISSSFELCYDRKE